MCNKANSDIREMLHKKNIKHWVLADYLNISESTLVKKLRKELSKTEKYIIKLSIIKIEKEGVKNVK